MDDPTLSFLSGLHQRAISPNAEALAAAMAGGDVAVLVFEPGRDAADLARALGWSGEGPVFTLSTESARLLASDYRERGDTVRAAWVEENRPGRMLVLAGDATFCLNVNLEAPGAGLDATVWN